MLTTKKIRNFANQACACAECGNGLPMQIHVLRYSDLSYGCDVLSDEAASFQVHALQVPDAFGCMLLSKQLSRVIVLNDSYVTFATMQHYSC